MTACNEGLGPPILFEAMTYDVYLESTGEAGMALSTDVPGMLTSGRSFKLVTGQGLSHYRLSLDGDVGILSLAVSKKRTGANGTIEVGRLEVEVFPRKLDYQRDYRAMLSAISATCSALVFEAAARTSLPSGPGITPGHTAREWYELLRALAGCLLAAVDAISADPARRLDARPRVVFLGQARRVTPSDLHRSFRVPGNLHRTDRDGLAALPFRVTERSSSPGFDAEANRHVHRLLTQILVRLRRLEETLASVLLSGDAGVGERSLAERWHREIAYLRPRLRRRLAYEWLSGVGEPRAAQPSATVQAHPAYSRVFEFGRALLRGLHVDVAPRADASVRPVWLLYEQWCFLAIVEILRRHGRVQGGSQIELQYDSAQVNLARGAESVIEFKVRGSGRPLRVTYNKSYRTPTVAQKPDASVQVEDGSKLHLFDAKYRVGFEPDYVKQYGGVGPRLEDINTMHRYRDAVVRESGGKYHKLVASACVLFPWRDMGSYRLHRFARSLDMVGVGGLPFLPGSTDMVAARLDMIVGEALGDGAA